MIPAPQLTDGGETHCLTAVEGGGDLLNFLSPRASSGCWRDDRSRPRSESDAEFRSIYVLEWVVCLSKECWTWTVQGQPISGGLEVTQ